MSKSQERVIVLGALGIFLSIGILLVNLVFERSNPMNDVATFEVTDVETIR